MKKLISKMFSEFKYFLIAVSNFHFKGNKKDIFIFSMPRAGSTWLMEIIASQPGVKFYDEPFNIRRENVKRSALFHDWEFSIPGFDNTDLILKYLNALQVNKYRFMNPAPFRRNHRFITNRIVFKIHEIEHLINHVKSRLNGNIVFLIRHPIANAISRNQLPRLSYFVKSSFFKNQFLTDVQKHEVNKIYTSGSEFEKSILSWCLQSLIPLKFLDRSDWLFLSYEELLLSPYKCCNLIYNKLELENFNDMLKAFDIPATNIAISSIDTRKIFKSNERMNKNRRLVKKWKKKINTNDESRAFYILEVFDIDIYKRNSFMVTDKYLNFPGYQEILL